MAKANVTYTKPVKAEIIVTLTLNEREAWVIKQAMRCVGRIGPSRYSADNVFDALQKLKLTGPELYDNGEITFVGDVD